MAPKWKRNNCTARQKKKHETEDILHYLRDQLRNEDIRGTKKKKVKDTASTTLNTKLNCGGHVLDIGPK